MLPTSRRSTHEPHFTLTLAQRQLQPLLHFTLAQRQLQPLLHFTLAQRQLQPLLPTQALQTLAIHSAQFPDDAALASGVEVIHDKSTKHAELLTEARGALDAHAFVVAVQQVQVADVVCVLLFSW